MLKERFFNVSLIEKIGEKGMREAWLTSKPTLAYKDEQDLQNYLDGVINNDLPLTGFHMFCLKIGSSIFFRDLMLTLRPIQVWALSSRITKLENLGLEMDYEPSKQTIDDYNKVVKMQAEGEALDLSKRYCPLQQYTEFCVVLDLRTLVAFCKTIKECDERLYETHCVPIINCVGLTPERINKISSKSIYSKLAMYEDADKKIDQEDGVRYQETDSSYELGIKVAFCLGAQFLRQHYARVRSSVWNRLKNEGYQKVMNTSNSLTQFYYSSTGEKSQWQQVCSRRICWEAQFCVKDDGERTSWNFILNKFFKKMSWQEFVKHLPCKGYGKNCTIFDEGKLRLFSKRDDYKRWTNNVPDENPICPVMCETPEYSIDLRQKMYHSEGDIWELWKQFAKEGIKDNPDNLARRFYFGETDDCPVDLSYFP